MLVKPVENEPVKGYLATCLTTNLLKFFYIPKCWTSLYRPNILTRLSASTEKLLNILKTKKQRQE